MLKKVKNPNGIFVYMDNRPLITEQRQRKLEIADILKNQFESIFSADDGRVPAFANKTEYVCTSDDLISRIRHIN